MESSLSEAAAGKGAATTGTTGGSVSGSDSGGAGTQPASQSAHGGQSSLGGQSSSGGQTDRKKLFRPTQERVVKVQSKLTNKEWEIWRLQWLAWAGCWWFQLIDFALFIGQYAPPVMTAALSASIATETIKAKKGWLLVVLSLVSPICKVLGDYWTGRMPQFQLQQAAAGKGGTDKGQTSELKTFYGTEAAIKRCDKQVILYGWLSDSLATRQMDDDPIQLVERASQCIKRIKELNLYDELLGPGENAGDKSPAGGTKANDLPGRANAKDPQVAADSVFLSVSGGTARATAALELDGVFAEVNADVATKLNTLRDEKERLLAELNLIKQNLAEANAKVADKEAQLTAANAAKQATEAEASDLKSQVQDLQGQVIALKASLEAAEKSVNDLHEELRTNKEIASLAIANTLVDKLVNHRSSPGSRP